MACKNTKILRLFTTLSGTTSGRLGPKYLNGIVIGLDWSALWSPSNYGVIASGKACLQFGDVNQLDIDEGNSLSEIRCCTDTNGGTQTAGTNWFATVQKPVFGMRYPVSRLNPLYLQLQVTNSSLFQVSLHLHYIPQ